MQLFTTRSSPSLDALNTMRPFPNTTRSKQYILILTDRYFIPEQAIWTQKAIGTHAACFFMDHRLILYGIPMYLLTNDWLKFVTKFFLATFALPGVRHITTMVYHPQKNSPVKQFSKKIFIQIRHYVAERQKYRNILVNRFCKFATHECTVKQSKHWSATILVVTHLDLLCWRPTMPFHPTAMPECPPRYCNRFWYHVSTICKQKSPQSLRPLNNL